MAQPARGCHRVRRRRRTDARQVRHRCAGCPVRIEPGEEIVRSADGSAWVHAACAASPGAAEGRASCRPAPPRCSPTARAGATPGPGGWAWAVQDGPQGSGPRPGDDQPADGGPGCLRGDPRSPRPAGGGERLDVRRELLQELLVDRLARPRLGELREEAGGQPRPVGAADRPGRGAGRRDLPLGQGPLGTPDERPRRPARGRRPRTRRADPLREGCGRSRPGTARVERP